MLLADAGADIIRVDRPVRARTSHACRALLGPPEPQPALRSGRSEASRGSRGRAGSVSGADALIEGFRPGVAERLGLGPDDCIARNERLVYGRMTGWGQDGPLAQSAGHDIDYIAIAGALWPIGRGG